MLAVRLPNDVEKQLDLLAKKNKSHKNLLWAEGRYRSYGKAGGYLFIFKLVRKSNKTLVIRRSGERN